jgi:hypothetical protein
LNPKSKVYALFDFKEIFHLPIYTNPIVFGMFCKGNNPTPIACMEAGKV